MYTERIREIYAELSPGYRKVADYLTSHYRDAAFMTASEIGRVTGVDTAQVVRLAQRLGYPGFPELVAEIQDGVKRDLQKVYEPTEDERQPAAIVQRTLIHDRNNLEYMRLHLDVPVVEVVVHLLNTAPRIFLLGEGNISFLAEAFANRLLAFGISAHLVSSELAAQAAAIAVTRPDDLFVGLGMTVLSPNVTVFLKMARAVGAHTIGIVSAMSNPVAGVAEHVLHAPANTVGLLPSLTAFTAILHGLTQAVAIARGYSMADWAVRTENYLREYKVALRTQIPNAAEIVRAYGAAPPLASQAEPSGAGSDRAASRPGASTSAPSANSARI